MAYHFIMRIKNRALPNGSKRSDQIFVIFTGKPDTVPSRSDIQILSLLCVTLKTGTLIIAKCRFSRAGRAAGPLTRGCTPRWGILPLQGRSFYGATHEGLHPPLGYFAPTGQVVLRNRSRGVTPPAGVFCPCRAIGKPIKFYYYYIFKLLTINYFR